MGCPRHLHNAPIRRAFIGVIVMVVLTLIFAVLLGIWTPVFNKLLKKGVHDSIVLNGPVRTCICGF